MAPNDDLEDGPVGLGERVRRFFAPPARLLAVLFTPDRAVPREVQARRYGAALLAVIICGLLAATAVGLRLDVSADVLAQASAGPMGPGAGPGAPGEGTATKSDREIDEEIAQTLAKARTMGALGAGVAMPLELFLLSIFVFLLTSYVGGKPSFVGAASASMHAALPHAVKLVVIGFAALGQTSLTPAQADGLVGNPLAPVFAGAGPVVARLFAGVDPFMIWSLVILGFGMSAAGQITRTRAFATLLVGFALFLAISRGLMG